jgi:hypothetical protein
VPVLAVLLGSTAFDSFSAMPIWRNFVDRRTRRELPGLMAHSLIPIVLG